MAESIYINKKRNKDLKNIEVKMNKMFIKMNNLLIEQFKFIEDQISGIETEINKIEEKLWPDYFYIEAVNDNTIVRPEIEGTGYLKYTKTPDDDSSWTNIGSLEDINLNAAEKVYFHGDLTPAQESGGGRTYAVIFHATNNIRCGGNVYYVADNDGKLTKSYQCAHMFEDNTYLLNAPELPATTLTTYCYDSMFYNCTGLTTAPELPATTLADHCYNQMFTGCTSLTTAPELPATTLADYCYVSMFNACSSLNYVKCLATDMTANDCIANWLTDTASTGTFVKDANTTWPSGGSGIPTGWTIINA